MVTIVTFQDYCEFDVSVPLVRDGCLFGGEVFVAADDVVDGEGEHYEAYFAVDYFDGAVGIGG